MSLYGLISQAVVRSTLVTAGRILWQPKLVKNEHFGHPGPGFVYGNHSNNLDPFVMNGFQPWSDATAGLVTMEQMRGTILTPFFKGIDLYGTRGWVAEPGLIRVVLKLLKEGRKIMIYPEGGRCWAGRQGDWIPATVKLFIRAGVPIYPVYLHGSYVNWPRWASYPRPGHMKVEWLKPILFDKKTPYDEAYEQLRAPFNVDENIVSEELRPKYAYKPAFGIHKLLYEDPLTEEPGPLYTEDGYVVRNRSGSISLKMLPDSRLRDEKQDVTHTTGDLYEKIRNRPLKPDSEGSVIREQFGYSIEHDFPKLTSYGIAEANLFKERIEIVHDTMPLTIPLEYIVHTGLERNYKLQLTTKKEMVELSFRKQGSALQWDDYIKRLKKSMGAR